MRNINSRNIVSAIVIKNKKILIQTRWKPKSSPAYTGMIEIPAGGIKDGEDARQAVMREVFEETGLKVTPRSSNRDDFYTDKGDSVQTFQPFICQQILVTKKGLFWIGFVFICDYVTGELKANPKECKDLRWVTKEELTRLVIDTPELIFPLQLPVLRQFLALLKERRIMKKKIIRKRKVEKE